MELMVVQVLVLLEVCYGNYGLKRPICLISNLLAQFGQAHPAPPAHPHTGVVGFGGRPEVGHARIGGLLSSHHAAIAA